MLKGISHCSLLCQLPFLSCCLHTPRIFLSLVALRFGADLTHVFLFLFHFSTSDLLTPHSSATFSHFLLTCGSLKRSRCFWLFALNSTVYYFLWLLPFLLSGFDTSCFLVSMMSRSSSTSGHSLLISPHFQCSWE